MDPRVERLLEISEPDFGFDPTAGGMAFAPVASAQYRLRFSLRDNVGPYDELPTHSNALREVVAAGADIVPALLDHLDDPRESACTVELTGLVYSAPHLDAFESGLRDVFKAGTESEWRGDSRYAVPLGDLCYVALGQIVNRQCWALYYQPSLIQIVNSPVHCPSVAKQVRDLWSNCDAEFLFQSLCSDLSNLTVKYRRESAVTRLMFYYPERSIEPITRELFRPAYSTYDVDLVYEALWALQSEVAVSDLLHTVTPATLGGVADTFAERADRMPGFRVCEDILFATVAERLGSRETWPVPLWRQLADRTAGTLPIRKSRRSRVSGPRVGLPPPSTQRSRYRCVRTRVRPPAHPQGRIPARRNRDLRIPADAGVAQSRSVPRPAGLLLDSPYHTYGLGSTALYRS